MTIAAFRKEIWAHYRRAGRGDMPWRRTNDPYRIFVSEVMLQQTQVARVMEYYPRFIRRFPDFRALARAGSGDVLAAWQGLGYNRRAIYLRRAAEIVMREFGGRLPRGRAALESLPGIGPGTSGSLMAFAFNEPTVFIETNIRRVFIHFFFPGRKKVTDIELERYIERSLDTARPREWYWALMDYGAAMASGSRTAQRGNPNRRSAHYKKQEPFTGSDREARGKILRWTLAAKKNTMSVRTLSRALALPRQRFESALHALEKEGFIIRKGDSLYIKQ